MSWCMQCGSKNTCTAKYCTNCGEGLNGGLGSKGNGKNKSPNHDQKHETHTVIWGSSEGLDGASEEAKNLFEEGKKEFKAGRYARAIDLFYSVIKENYNLKQVWHEKGENK